MTAAMGPLVALSLPCAHCLAAQLPTPNHTQCLTPPPLNCKNITPVDRKALMLSYEQLDHNLVANAINVSAAGPATRTAG
jgi:hypothetical protein